jgi:flagellar assembly factor FliW
MPQTTATGFASGRAGCSPNGSTVESTRFGTLEVEPDAVIEFPAGLIGLGGHRFVLLARDEDSAFAWLHSLEEGDLALPVTNPFRFFEDYEVEISDAEAERIGVTDPADADVWVTVRAGTEATDFTANLLAPILVSHGRGHQVINEAAGVDVKAPLFAGDEA